MNASGDIHYKENKEISIQMYKYFFYLLISTCRYPWFKKNITSPQHISSAVILDLKNKNKFTTALLPSEFVQIFFKNQKETSA